MDSLTNYHNPKKYCKRLLKWLNHEWARLNKGKVASSDRPFGSKMVIKLPKGER